MMSDKKAVRIGLVGYYRQMNYGDDLLAVLFHRKLSNLGAREIIVFDCDEAIQRGIGVTDAYPWKDHYRRCSCVVFGGGGGLGELVPGNSAGLYSWITSKRSVICAAPEYPTPWLP